MIGRIGFWFFGTSYQSGSADTPSTDTRIISLRLRKLTLLRLVFGNLKEVVEP